MTYTVTYGPDARTRGFTRKEDAIDFLRNLPITVCGEVRDSAGTQWAVRQG